MRTRFTPFITWAAVTFMMLLTSVSAWADGSGTPGDPWISGGCAVTLSGGTLTVSKSASGNGAMEKYTVSANQPWYSEADNITSIVIGSGVTSIGNFAFAFFTNLTSVTFEANSHLETIRYGAFSGCNNAGFTSITIPASVTSIGGYAFNGCTNLATVTFEPGSQLTTIGISAFFNCKLATFTIPANVTTIYSQAFENCTTLASITIPTSVTSIGNEAFENCTTLASITIPTSVTSIGNEAFRNCDNLATVTIYAPSLTTYGSNAFYNNAAGRQIYVFKDCVGTYKSNWSSYNNDIKPLELAVKAADDADVTKGKWCSYYNGLADVTVPAGTTVYTAKFNADKSRVNLTETGSQIIKKGEAVLLKSNADIELSSAASSGDGVYTGNELKGVDVATPQAAGKTYYVMSKKTGKDFGFYKLASGTNLGANKAYLEVSTSGAPEFIGFGKDETTSLTPSPSLGGEGSEYWYTLDGRRIFGKPTKKGVYVVNGQKVVIK